jgi:hypothetical protein
LNETANPRPLPDHAVAIGIVEASKKISWKHGFDKPDRSSIG